MVWSSELTVTIMSLCLRGRGFCLDIWSICGCDVSGCLHKLLDERRAVYRGLKRAAFDVLRSCMHGDSVGVCLRVYLWIHSVPCNVLVVLATGTILSMPDMHYRIIIAMPGMLATYLKSALVRGENSYSGATAPSVVLQQQWQLDGRETP